MRHSKQVVSSDHPDYVPPFDASTDDEYLERARKAIVRDVQKDLRFADEVLTETIIAPESTAAKDAGASLALAFQRAVAGDEKGAQEEFLRAAAAIMAAYPDLPATRAKGAPTNVASRAESIYERESARWED